MIKLPSVITEDVWFYENNKEVLKEHLGKPYISYSSISSWEEYNDDYIKNKFAGIPSETVYTRFGNYLGEAVENGEFGEENPDNFIGQENFELIPRTKKGYKESYERFVVLDFGEFIFIGFIDMMFEKKKKAFVEDLKTGGNKKEVQYSLPKYVQVVLYAMALLEEGYDIEGISVWFVRRTGSHIKPPLKISDEQFRIELPFTEERIEYALDKVNRVVKEISDLYKTYLKFFGNE